MVDGVLLRSRGDALPEVFWDAPPCKFAIMKVRLSSCLWRVNIGELTMLTCRVPGANRAGVGSPAEPAIGIGAPKSSLGTTALLVSA